MALVQRGGGFQLCALGRVKRALGGPALALALGDIALDCADGRALFGQPALSLG